MPLSTRIHETELRVRYAETDASGVAHHAAYVSWLETGRVEWLRSAGSSYTALEELGYELPVVELRVRYVKAARFDDLLVVRTALTEIRSRSVAFAYEVLLAGEHAVQLASGTSRHICLRHGVVAPLPDVVRALAE